MENSSEASPWTPDRWAVEIRTAFQYGDAPPLAVAEQAVRECPGDYELLALAATAALVEGRTDRAQLFLKRMKKRGLGVDYPNYCGTCRVPTQRSFELSQRI